MMKKTIAVLLSFIMVICLAACGNSADQTENPGGTGNETGSGTGNNAQEGADGADQAENADENDTENTKNPGSTESSETQQPGETSEAQGSKVLVVYFSATNTTEGVAEHIANGLNADIYEIIPEEPYTDADLDYHDNNSRSTIEMNDPSSRPAISGSVENMEQYDVVFLGYAGGIIGLN